MTTAVSLAQIQSFLAETSPFDRLPADTLKTLLTKCQLLGYRTGQPLFEREKMPTQVSVIYQGQARLLGWDQRAQRHVSLRLVEPKEVLGWAGLVRGIACETVIASTEVIAITIPAAEFLNLMTSEPQFGAAFETHSSLSEAFELVGLELQRRADGSTNSKEAAQAIAQEAVVVTVPNGTKKTQELVNQLDTELMWLVSSGVIGECATGSRLSLASAGTTISVDGPRGVRLLGFRELGTLVPEMEADPLTDGIQDGMQTPVSEGEISPLDLSMVTAAPERPPAPPLPHEAPITRFPLIRAKGQVNGPVACFQMLSKHFGLKFRKEIVQKIIENQYRTVGNLSMQACGAIVQSMGINAQLAQVPANAVNRLKAPALIPWRDSFAIIYSITEKEVMLASPEEGFLRKKPAQFAEVWGEAGQVLLLQAPHTTDQKEQFSFWWFLPALKEHRTVLIEVLLASFFVQMFGLVNPLVTQIIIDKVLVQRSIDTLHILGVFLLGIALFNAMLGALRTFLFVDTTNRLDVKLSSEVIDHLLRLPLSYFDNRRVGELAGRLGELANIRGFMTGTAMTVVLNAVFSVIYIAVMLSYSGLMTAVALGAVPIFTIMIVIMTPVIKRLLRKRAERYADSQSYLIEVLNGIQTVKAQNIELKSRWQWSARYARFMTASFNTVLTQTVTGSISSFLGQVSNLALLWVGAYQVLNGDLSLGQLIAFRIIAGNVSSSLLGLVGVWQQFQEVGMSIERLQDVLDTAPEADEEDRNNIALPPLEGAVKFEEVCFRFTPSGPLQLTNVTLEFPAGTFVGIVGQSGSGKSTLMKLLERLYPPLSGRILIDNYDISKVELYSVRSQIGVVLQDTLLFNGTVQENIALSNPDASTDDIIRAAKIAVAHDFIMGLPQGYNTVVGERGSSLSGGQRQRIAIARTVLQNPRLLILDEATSALDYISERQVCNNLAENFDNRTVFFITHRLTTVRNADVIIMMDQGSVVEQGSHDELMALKGRYYCLYQQQEAQQ